MPEMEFLGNKGLLDLPKTAFLCSRKAPASAVLKCYDWAIAQRDAGNCVISGFHSQLEKDVFHYLLKGTQPIIMVLARGLKERMEPQLKEAIEAQRLVIVTPFDKSVRRITKQTAHKRNQFMLALADSITIGYISPGGSLETTIDQVNKPKTLLH